MVDSGATTFVSTFLLNLSRFFKEVSFGFAAQALAFLILDKLEVKRVIDEFEPDWAPFCEERLGF